LYDCVVSYWMLIWDTFAMGVNTKDVWIGVCIVL
jgi:hypothetical protein